MTDREQLFRQLLDELGAVKRGVMKLGGEVESAEPHIPVDPRLNEIRQSIEHVMHELPIKGAPFARLHGVLVKLDELCGQPVTKAEPDPIDEPFTEQQFDKLPPEEQQVVVDNMALPTNYIPPAAWVEA